MAPKIGTEPARFYRARMEHMAVNQGTMIRPAQHEDAAAMAGLIRRCFAEHVGRVDPPPSALGETEASVAGQIAATGGAIAAERGVIVACVLWAEKEGGLYVGRLAVAPECRGRGLARALLAAAESESRRRGLPRLHLGTRLALADNRALFASCGFRECGRFSHAGFSGPTWVALEKMLA